MGRLDTGKDVADTRKDLGNNDVTVSRWLTMYSSPSSSYEDIRQPSFDQIRAGFDVEDIGGLAGYFRREQQVALPDKSPFTTEELGGSLRLGPFRGSAGIGETTFSPIPLPFRQDFTDPDVDIGSRRARLDVEIPPFTGGVGRTWGDVRFPQHASQSERRQTSLPHRTDVNIGLGGRLGIADLRLQGQYGRTRGQKPSIGAGFTARIPF